MFGNWSSHLIVVVRRVVVDAAVLVGEPDVAGTLQKQHVCALVPSVHVLVKCHAVGIRTDRAKLGQQASDGAAAGTAVEPEKIF